MEAVIKEALKLIGNEFTSALASEIQMRVRHKLAYQGMKGFDKWPVNNDSLCNSWIS